MQIMLMQVSSRGADAFVAAVVVTHDPDWALLTQQTKALWPQVARLIWVDNGSQTSVVDLAKSLQVECIQLSVNKGIAYAQNVGVQMAWSVGASHVLLMDHDSIPAAGMVEQLLLALQRDCKVAAAGPWYQDPRGEEGLPFIRIQCGRTVRLERPLTVMGDGESVEVDHLIASGCLIRREAWLAVGPMKSQLFIDFVDVEWCLRAQSLGWVVVGVWNAQMSHELGQSVTVRWGKRFHVHPPSRHFYQTRNAVYLLRQAWIPVSRRWATGYRLLLKCGFYVLLMDNRMSYIAATLKGIWHGLRLSIPSSPT